MDRPTPLTAPAQDRLHAAVQHGLSRLDALTPRERELLGLMAEGWSNATISEFMGLRSKTVETHVRNIFEKLALSEEPHVHRRVLATRIVVAAELLGVK